MLLRIVAHVVLNGLALVLTAHLVPGITYTGGIPELLVAGFVLGLINTIVKPLLKLLTLPLIVFTLGLFYLVLNGALLWLAGELLDGLTIEGCGPAILGGLVLALFNAATKMLPSD